MTRLLFTDREVDVGRLRPCSIVFNDIRELSACHLKIIRDNEDTTLYIQGKNGCYINDRFAGQGEKRHLSYTDEISFFGVRILWLDDTLAIHTEDEMTYEINNLKQFVLNDYEAVPDNNNFFFKAPRTYYSVQDEIIELDPPPERHIEENQPLFMTIGPAFTMALPMIIGVSVSRLATKSAGGTQVFMYTGLITAVSSAFLGIMWGLSNIKNRNNRMLINEKKRRVIYRQYVRDSELKIREQYNKKASRLRLMYPEIGEYVPDGINRFLLWNRSDTDEDFLRIRIGTGNVPCSMNIGIPKERFSMVEDELKDLPKRLKAKYSELADVPDTLDLKEEKYVGIVSDSKRLREETFLSLVIMIAVMISPGDLSIEWNLEHDIVGEEVLNAVRFLPHHNKKKTEYNSEQRIVFTDNYEKIKDINNEQTYMFIISDHFERLPSVCRFIIQREAHFSGYMKLDRNCSIRRNIHFDMINAAEAERIARLLQGIKVKSKEEEFVLPDKFPYLELFERKPDGRGIYSEWAKNDIRSEISCPIGISEDGSILNLNLHEKGMGPHGLIAGMTGSGKSEILQTIILSLSVNYSPEDVGFFLIDYKGGGMSKLFENLPHVMGSISNLSGKMIERAMVSVKSENERRQKLFIEAGVNNINGYKSASMIYKDMEPLPHIFIIIDEFAELKKEEPEFMKDLISVARVGRSLGVHLILATQKPAGVVDDNVFSNSRFRICLRVQDRIDSMEMLKRKDAADITNVGRAILQVGNDEILKTFQSAYTMDKSGASHKKKFLKVYNIDGDEIERRRNEDNEAEEKTSQLSRVLIQINEANALGKYRKLRPLWLKPLPEIIERNIDTESVNRLTLSIGMYDNPLRQSQGELTYSLIQAGNTLIAGGLQSGKSTLLVNILLSLLLHTKYDFYNIYIIDFSNGMLRPFRDSIMCDGFISEDNEEDIEKLFVLITDIADERKTLLNSENYSSHIQSKTTDDEEYLPPVILIIDGLQSLRERTQGRYDKQIETLLKVSEGVGIFVFATVMNMSSHEISKRMCDCFKTCLPLNMKDKYEYKDALRVQTGNIIMPECVSGRGISIVDSDICEFQVYRPGTVSEISSLVNEMNKHIKPDVLNKNKRPLPVIPKELNIISFMEEIEKRNEVYNGKIPIGFFKGSGKVACIPYSEKLTVLITGRKGSGKNNLLDVIIQSATNLRFEITSGLKDCEDNCQDGRTAKYIEFENGMQVYVYDEKLPFDVLKTIKEKAGADPYVIHLGGAIDRQNVADYSYIPYSKQAEISKAGLGIIRKTLSGNEYGEIIVPLWKESF